MKMKLVLVLGAVLGLTTTRVALADPTALQLVKSGNDYVGMPSRDKVLQVYSEKSVGTLEPNLWHVVYYDPTVFFRTVEVKFGGGQEMDVSHPMRPFTLPASASDILDRSKLTVDSDRALSIATSQPLLKGLTLKSTRMTLENGDTGPMWKVELYAAKVNDPTKEADIGTVRISASDMSVAKADLHPSDAD
jgi:hypothetical protein